MAFVEEFKNMKSFVFIDPEYLKIADISRPYCFEATHSIPCIEVPRDVGPYLEIKPLSLEGPDPLSSPFLPAFAGSIRVPHSVVVLIVDSDDDRVLGFFDQSFSPPFQE